MLKFDVPDDLLHDDKQGELFFAQRAVELSYSYTKESYRIATTTVPFLILECLSVIEDHRKFDLNKSAVERVVDELRRRCHQNLLAQKLAKMPLDFYLPKNIEDIYYIEDCIRVLSKEISPRKYLIEAAEAILEAKPNEKDKINFLVSELLCTLVNMGVSREYLYEEACRIFFQDDGSSGLGRLAAFIKKVIETQTDIPEFSAIVPIEAEFTDVNEAILKLFRAKIVTEVPDTFALLPEFANFTEGRSLLFITGLRSPDYYSAAKLLKRNIVRLYDLLGLFYHKGTNDFGPCTLIARTGLPTTSLLVRFNQNLMQMISDNPRTLAARKLETMVTTLRLPGGEDGEKFFRVVEFHGMSLGSPIPENQLINLWTSLETIAPSVKGKSIIGGVCKRALPIIGGQYVSRTFLNAARDIKRWDNKKFKSAMKGVQKGEGIVEKTFHLICDPTYDGLCTSLLAEMQDFPLLKHRIHSLNKRFKSGKNAAAEIRLHMTKAEQQLHRIYRARNSIVHSAQKDQLTENLIISAHEYFDQIFSVTAELCSTPLMFDNYRDAFNYCEMSFDAYIQGLDDLKDEPISQAKKFIWSAS